MHNKNFFYFENERQGDEAQHPRWCLSIANIKIKDIIYFCASFHPFRDIMIYIICLPNKFRSRSYSIIHNDAIVVVVSVEALVFIVIGRSCSEGCGFDSHCRPGSFLRFNSWPITYGAVGSLVLSWSWTRQPGFIFFWCLWIKLCNNFGQRLCACNLL